MMRREDVLFDGSWLMTRTVTVEAGEKLVNDLHPVFVGVEPVGQDHEAYPLLSFSSRDTRFMFALRNWTKSAAVVRTP